MGMTQTFDEATSQAMDVVKEVVNIARRVANAVDSSTAAYETDSTSKEASGGVGPDLSKLSDVVSPEDMTGCMGVVEARAQLAIKLFSDVLKTPAGKAIATAFAAQSKRDASLRLSPSHGGPPMSPSPAVRPTTTGGFGSTSSFENTGSSVPVIDVASVLQQYERV